MKVKRIGKFLLVWLCIITILLPFGSNVLAAALTSDSTTAILETIPLRQGGKESSGAVTSNDYDKNSYSYKISGVNVLKIVQNNDYSYSDMIYCMNGLVSFPTSATVDGFKYTNQGDFSDKSNSEVKKWAESIGISNENYNSLINLLNNIYLMKQDTSYKKEYIEKAFADVLAEETIANGYPVDTTAETIMTYLTDDDIDAIQQWAIWHFTNGTNSSNEYYEEVFSKDDLGVIEVESFANGTTPTTTDISGVRLEYAKKLYKYLINNAAVSTKNNENESYPSINKTKAVTSEVSGDNYKVGPFKVNSGTYVPSDFELNLKFFSSDGKELSDVNYVIRDANGNEINDLSFDTEFYVYLPIKDNKVSNVTLTSNYTTKGERKITYWTGEDETKTYNNLQPVVILTQEPGKPVEEEITGKITEAPYDLALRKFIVSVNGEATEGRTPEVSGLDKLADGSATTAIYSHAKSPVTVSKGDKVIYEFRIYNEGKVDAKVGEIVDYIPDSLTVVKTGSTVNSKYNWKVGETSDGFTTITTDYLKNTNIPAFDSENLNLSYVVVQVECEITGDLSTGTILTNVAEIVQDNGEDRDSNPGSIDKSTLTNNFSGNTSNKSDLTDSNYYYKGLEDDDDFEKLIIDGDVFDLSLKKFITSVNGEEPNKSREPKVDVTPLKNDGIDAKYTTTKTPINVETGDIVTFTIRVYNEGDIDGYANEITDYIPEGLGLLVNYKTNYDNYWSISEDSSSVKLSTIKNGTKNLKTSDFVDVDNLDDVEVVLGQTKVKTKALAYSETSKSNLIKAFDGNKLDYKDVQISCIVTTEDQITLKNIAAITGEKDSDGVDIDTDRDSRSVDSTPEDDINPDEYTDGNEDDDDYDVVKTTDKDFDLALQKFISEVNGEEITSRVPTLSLDDKGEIVYTHDSEPLALGNGDYVTYTIRVYNEGDIDGYASEITDDIPKGLIFITDNETNKEYEWVMLDSSGNETTDVDQAVAVKTSYLSKEKSEDNLIKAFDTDKELSDVNPDYKDVKLVFKIEESELDRTTTTADRTLTNTAEITKNTDKDGNDIQDKDSTPGNNDLEEDDIDQEKVYVKYFDLSLKKDLQSADITVDGQTTHKTVPAGQNTIKVEVNRRKVNQTEIKFTYNITITNEGEISGSATEITDYIPEGLAFDQSDNPDWVQVSDKVISTNGLAKKILAPGESVSIPVVLRWERSADNTGVFINIAEITDDWNEYDSPDIDSTPNNKVPTEDDYDTAPVYVGIATGLGLGLNLGNQYYIILSATVLVILAGGVILIKKFVI